MLLRPTACVLLPLALALGCMDRPAATDLSRFFDSSGSTMADVTSCTPGVALCTSDTTWATCNPFGNGVSYNFDCPPETICDHDLRSCVPEVCPPTGTVCTDIFHYQTCNRQRGGFGPVMGCQQDFLCVEGSCQYAACVPLVLLIVDGSSGMSEHWDTIQNSVQSLVADNPNAAIGLLGFPDCPIGAQSCATAIYPQISVGDHPWSIYHSYFTHNLPTGGAPLAKSLSNVATLADSIFYGRPGAIIVLSSGGDTCADDPEATMITATQTLWAEHSIRTFVIGYAFDGEDSQLQAIAANGGTQLDTYIPAGNEAELEAAFQSLTYDFKLCGAP